MKFNNAWRRERRLIRSPFLPSISPIPSLPPPLIPSTTFTLMLPPSSTSPIYPPFPPWPSLLYFIFFVHYLPLFIYTSSCLSFCNTLLYIVPSAFYSHPLLLPFPCTFSSHSSCLTLSFLAFISHSPFSSPTSSFAITSFLHHHPLVLFFLPFLLLHSALFHHFLFLYFSFFTSSSSVFIISIAFPTPFHFLLFSIQHHRIPLSIPPLPPTGVRDPAGVPESRGQHMLHPCVTRGSHSHVWTGGGEGEHRLRVGHQVPAELEA